MSEPNDPNSPQENRPNPPATGPHDASLPVPVAGANDGVFNAVSNSSAAVRPEILTAPPKPLDLLRSLQRRWLLAAVLGMMLGIPAAVVTWFVVPVEFTAEAVLQFNEGGQLVEQVDRSTKHQKDPLQTHISLIKSPLVLNAALARPGIADISWFKELRLDQEDEVSWLKKKIQIVNPRTTSILLISMSGDEARPVEQIVNAVAEAYLDKVVAHERNQLLSKVERLNSQLRRKEEDIRQRRAAYTELVEAVDAVDGSTAASQRQFLDEQKIGLAAEIGIVRTNVSRKKLDIEQMKLIQAGDPEELKEEMIQQLLSQDAQYFGLMGLVQQLQDREKELALISRGGASKPLTKIRQRIADTQKQADDLRQTIIEKLEPEDFEHPIVQKIDLHQKALMATENHLTGLIGELEEVQRNIQRLTVHSPELQQRKDELARMEAVSNEVGLRLEKLQLELNISDSKVTFPQRATVPEMHDSSARDRFTIMAALAGFALAAAGVSLYEFQFRRLSSSHDMTEGLGMQVMGDVPMLTERHWRLPGMNGVNPDSLQGMMDESVDSIRSLLLHSAAYQSVQVIMVTSANSGEGKTTVASSLAASMGRSGRRTLLVDGDLRRPAVHRMLDLPLDMGLSEVLRGEASVEEAIRPSRAPGLWVMPAGRCDHESIQSLTKEVFGTTLEKLRDEFDMIVVDTGPVLSVVDPLLIGQHCDGAIVSVVRRVSQITNVYDTCQRLQNTGIRLLGSVVNGVTSSQLGIGYYGYGYGYNDGYGQHELPQEVAET